MQIHEITKKQLSEASPTVNQVWSQLAGDVMATTQARFTKDPRYANLPMAQRVDVMRRDANVKEIATKAAEQWNQQVSSMMYRNQNQPVTPAVYQTTLQNWMNKSYFNGNLSNIDPQMKSQVMIEFQNITKNRDDPDQVADGINKLISIAATTKIAQAPAAIAQPGPAGGTGIARGFRYAVPYTAPGQDSPSYYYKNISGWRNEEDQAIDDPRSVQYLDNLLQQLQAAGKIKAERDPTATAPGAAATNRRRVSRKR